MWFLTGRYWTQRRPDARRANSRQSQDRRPHNAGSNPNVCRSAAGQQGQCPSTFYAASARRDCRTKQSRLIGYLLYTSVEADTATIAIRGHCTICQQVFDCIHLSCKICFNVLNYVFILFIFNFYCLVNIQQPGHNSSHRD